MFNAFKTLKSPRPWGEDLGEGGRFEALKRKPTPTPPERIRDKLSQERRFACFNFKALLIRSGLWF